jgi:ADP-ribosylglycohydrolase
VAPVAAAVTVAAPVAVAVAVAAAVAVAVVITHDGDRSRHEMQIIMTVYMFPDGN